MPPNAALPRAILSLDVATITGFAWGALADVVPLCGIWELPGDPLLSVGRKVAALENTVIDFLNAQPTVDLVVLAERFVGRSIAQVRLSFALDGVVEAECWRRGLRLVKQPETTVRREMFGRTGRTDDMKAAALAWCARQGIAVPDHNGADAAVLWRWTRDELVRQRGVTGVRAPVIRPAPRPMVA